MLLIHLRILENITPSHYPVANKNMSQIKWSLKNIIGTD